MEITPGYGPASTPDVSRIGEARLRVLRALQGLVERGEPGTVTRVAELVRAHPNGVRRHIERLADARLVAATRAAPAGRGRPSTTYDVTAAGRAALAGAAAVISTEYLGLAAAFADHLTERSADPAEAAREIGRSWGHALASRTGGGECALPADAEPAGSTTTRLFTLLGELGFSPVRRAADDVALHTCPLLAAARAHPEVLCQVHLGLVQGASAAYGGPADGGELVPFGEPGACVLRLPGESPVELPAKTAQDSSPRSA